MSSGGGTFVDACFAGSALLDDIDDWVDAWHDANGRPRDVEEGLSEYLGLTEFEYALWAERPSSLRTIIAARHQNRPIATVESAADYALAAARTGKDEEAAKLIEWLKLTGRLKEDEFQ